MRLQTFSPRSGRGPRNDESDFERGADPCNTGWSATEYYIAANKAWLADNPAAAKLFEMAKIGLEDRVVQNIAMKNGEDSEKDLRRHAEEWIGRNQAEFDAWIAAAKAAAN